MNNETQHFVHVPPRSPPHIPPGVHAPQFGNHCTIFNYFGYWLNAFASWTEVKLKEYSCVFNLTSVYQNHFLYLYFCLFFSKKTNLPEKQNCIILYIKTFFFQICFRFMLKFSYLLSLIKICSMKYTVYSLNILPNLASQVNLHFFYVFFFTCYDVRVNITILPTTTF